MKGIVAASFHAEVLIMSNLWITLPFPIMHVTDPPLPLTQVPAAPAPQQKDHPSSSTSADETLPATEGMHVVALLFAPIKHHVPHTYVFIQVRCYSHL
jgi:hypothetical protein